MRALTCLLGGSVLWSYQAQRWSLLACSSLDPPSLINGSDVFLFVMLWNTESIQGCSSAVDLKPQLCSCQVVNGCRASLNLEWEYLFSWYEKSQSRFSYYMKIIPFYREKNVDITHDRAFGSYSWRLRWLWSAYAIRGMESCKHAMQCDHFPEH